MFARLVPGSIVIIALASLAGCSSDSGQNVAEEAASSEAELGARAWPDHVIVRPDRLVFDGAVARSEDFQALVARVADYQREYEAARAEAPLDLADGELDAWIVDRLTQRNVTAVYLVGKRQSNVIGEGGVVRAGANNPNGYLRRAIAASLPSDRGAIEIATLPASIFEAHTELEHLGFSELNAVRSGEDGTNDQWAWSRQYPFSLMDIDLSRVLYQKTMGAGLGKVEIGLKDSHLNVRGNVDAGAAGRWVSPREAHAILSLDLDGQLVLDGRFDGAFGASSGTVSLFHQSYSIATVGGFPLTFDLDVTGQCDVASNGQAHAAAGAQLAGSLAAGGSYLRGQGFDAVWQPVWPEFSPVGPTLTSSARVEGGCAIEAKAAVHLFDAMGPEATAGAFVTLEANGSTSGLRPTGTGHAKVVAGVDASIGGSLRPFGVNLATITAPPYHDEWVIFDQPITF